MLDRFFFFLLQLSRIHLSKCRIRFPYPLQWGIPNVDAGHVFMMMAAVFVSLVEVYILLPMFNLIFWIYSLT